MTERSLPDLTPTSFLQRLPGSPKVRAPRRHELAVLPAATEPVPSRTAEDDERDRETFESSLDTAVNAFIGHDPFDVALVLTLMLADVRQDDATVIGSLPASELGWTLVAAGLPHGPPRVADVAHAVVSVYDHLKAAAFLGQPTLRTAQPIPRRSPHEEFFSHSRLVRNVRFDDQEREVLISLWGAKHGVDRYREMLGLGIEQLLDLVDGSVREQASRVDALPARPLRGGDGRAVSFTADDLAVSLTTPRDVVALVLDLLSSALGTASRPRLHGDTDAIRHAPLLRDGERHLLVSPDLLLRALLPRLEQLLADRPPRERESYQRRRGRWVEDTATATLSAFIRPAFTQNGLVHDDGEIDGLVAFDNILILVEAKAKSLRVARRLDDPRRYDTDVSELVVDACDGLRRGRRALRRRATFRDRHGNEIRIPVTKDTRIISVIVTLEQFWPLAAHLWRLRASGRLSAREPLPWMLTLAHLQTICELLEWPTQLVHFLTRRLEIDSRIFGSDEIDFVMAYLRWGLDFDQILTPEVGSLLLPTGNDEVNEWIFSERGWWTKRLRRPQLEMAPSVLLEARARLNELDQVRADGWVDRSLGVLDWALGNTPRTPRQRPF
jgi:hypothetical protein